LLAELKASYCTLKARQFFIVFLEKFIERRFFMLIVFFTREKKVCELIAERLEEKGHLAFVFTNLQKVLKAVGSRQSQKVDLLALDFRMGEQKDPGWSLLISQLQIPVVYYNDPYSFPGNFAVNWNRKVTSERKISACNLMPVFRDLESVMVQQDILPYVSLVCPPKKILGREEREVRLFNIERFREKYSVQPSKYKLLHYFYQNRGVVLDAKRLCLFMWNEYSYQKKETLFSYICYLRKLFRKENSYCLRIINEGRYGYVFRITCPKFRCEKNETAYDYIRPNLKSGFDFLSANFDE